MGHRSLRAAIGVAGFLWGLTSEALYYAAGTPAHEVLLDLAIGWTYLYGGLALWANRPSNRTGPLMTLVGLTWFVGNLAVSSVPALHEIGVVLSGVAATALVALILAYPSGRLETRLDRATVAILGIGLLATNVLTLLPLSESVALGPAIALANGSMVAFAGVVIIRRWVVAPRRRRRELVPVLIAGLVQMVVLAIFVAVQLLTVPESLSAVLLAAKNLAPAAIPLSVLVGFYRQSESRQRALLDAMPDLMIRLTADGHYLDLSAKDSLLLSGSPESAVGGRIGDILPADAADRLLGAASAATDRGTLQTFDVTVDSPIGPREFETRVTRSGADEVTAIVRDFTDQRAAQAELRRSRTRIVEATDAERRRIERDLHDGAQQRLVSLALTMRLARSKTATDPREADELLENAGQELDLALAELRELARGIHPAVLTDRGLGAALEALAGRAPFPVELVHDSDQTLPDAVETAAYFVVSEALTNVAKYSRATEARVSVSRVDGHVLVEVADNGVGGADPEQGTGLRGLADRVSALDGRLAIASPDSGGTTVSARIPCG
jgi:signal transduction histidine kinase